MSELLEHVFTHRKLKDVKLYLLHTRYHYITVDRNVYTDGFLSKTIYVQTSSIHQTSFCLLNFYCKTMHNLQYTSALCQLENKYDYLLIYLYV